MKSSKIIKNIKAYQILNSRGTPTIEVCALLTNNQQISVSVPQGASTGEHEIPYLYDGIKEHYAGKTVYKAIDIINKKILPEIISILGTIKQSKFDDLIKQLTEAGNIRLVLSILHAKISANLKKKRLYQHISDITSITPKLPIPAFNILNGGAHAKNTIRIQEFMIVPKGISSFPEQLEAGAKVFSVLKNILVSKNECVGVGDEGGFAPNLGSDMEALDLILQAIEKSGYVPGKDIYIALDVAISQYYDKQKQRYYFDHQGKNGKLVLTNAKELTDYYVELVKKYPIVSIEDGLDENDWENWPYLTQELQKQNIISVGDDFIVTNPNLLVKAIKHSAITGLIIKPNQVGTLTETLEVIKLAKKNKIVNIASHRSGETNDPFISHIAVGAATKFMKSGAPNRGERINKYNELLRIYYDLASS